MVTIKIKRKLFEFDNRVIAYNELLKHGKQYNYNMKCRCGTIQSRSSFINWYTKHNAIFDKDYVCKDCSQTEQFTIFNKTWNTFADCVDYANKHNKFKCSICNKKLEVGSYRYWIKELLKDPNKTLMCKPCKDSISIQKYNNSPKHHEDLIRINRDTSFLRNSLITVYNHIINDNRNVMKLTEDLKKFILKDKHFKSRKISLNGKIFASWKNLLKEWTIRNRQIKNKETYIYYAKSKLSNKELKIGISNNPNHRYSDKSNFYDIQIIRSFDNRYQAAYVEYKLRTLFCKGINNEIIDKRNILEVIDYVNSIHYNKSIEKELKILGWKF